MALHFGCLSLAVTELPLALMAALRMAIQPFVGGAPGTWRAALYNMYMYIVTVTLSADIPREFGTETTTTTNSN